MLFVSVEFFLFFIIVFALFWSVGRLSIHAPNMVLLAAGFFFYGWADVRFLGLLVFSALVNYGLGLFISTASNERRRSLLFWTGVAINVGLLGYFKYFEFFVNSFIDVLNLSGSHHAYRSLHIALPLGISFYTFQMLGYLIDVDNEEMEPCRKPLHFFTYVFFFPKMLAGPVERAQHFLPQIEKAPRFDRALAVDGCRQFLWGLFAKVVLAENCATHVDAIYAQPHAEGSSVLLAACLYLIQLYCDFSGYSNMAIGAGKLLGITMRPNFRYPLFAINISDFWRRWHVSLTSWMMDYLFTPLSFLLRDSGKQGMLLAISATFMAVGIWHGANWTFILFGAVQCIYFIPMVLGGGLNRPVNSEHATLPSPGQFLRMLGMFLLMSLTFILVRATNVHQAADMLRTLTSTTLLSATAPISRSLFLGILAFLCWEWHMRRNDHALRFDALHWPRAARLAVYYGLLFLVGMNLGVQNDFIYFQF